MDLHCCYFDPDFNFKLEVMDLQEYLKNINPSGSNLIYGLRYNCYLKNEFIGVFTWTKDENIGVGFVGLENIS